MYPKEFLIREAAAGGMHHVALGTSSFFLTGMWLYPKCHILSLRVKIHSMEMTSLNETDEKDDIYLDFQPQLRKSMEL